jgi:hypothetical protein
VRMVRSGSTFTAYSSTDGAAWTTVGSVSISMASSVTVGLAVTSHADGTLATAVFDNVSVIGGGPTPTPTRTNTPPALTIHPRVPPRRPIPLRRAATCCT